MTPNEYIRSHYDLDTPFKRVNAAIDIVTCVEDLFRPVTLGSANDESVHDAAHALKATLIQILESEFGYGR